MWIDFTPDPESDTMVDFCLRVYVIVVELDGEMKIGYVEPGE
jgi:very-short-patch-repair endonuclease